MKHKKNNDTLDATQLEIVDRASRGQTTKVISAGMNIGEEKLEKDCGAIYRILHVRNMKHAIGESFRNKSIK
jgi:DNA-binding CsgD family transcriptional regulator